MNNMIDFLLWAATHSDFKQVDIILPFHVWIEGSDNQRFLCISLDWELIYPWWMNDDYQSFQQSQELRDADPHIYYGNFQPDDIPF